MTIDGQPGIILRVYKDGKLIDRIEDPAYIPTVGTYYKHQVSDTQVEKLWVTEISGTPGGKLRSANVDCHTTA